MATIRLCNNCLEIGAAAVPVGYDKGHQMDPHRDTVDLCPTCRSALLSGDFATLSSRHTDERVIRVDAQGGR